MKKEIISISGTSGSGKSYFVNKILETYPYISEIAGITTRAKRPGEIDGQSSYYLSKDEFEILNKKNELLLVKEIFDNQYAWYKKDLINNEQLRIMNISYTSISSLQLDNIKLCSVFIRPNSEKRLVEFLSERNAPESEFKKRLNDFYNSENFLMQNAGIFDYIVNNDYTERSLSNIINIIGNHSYNVNEDYQLQRKI